jgi:dinuclear metal center YbgI/SA1388 family protein
MDAIAPVKLAQKWDHVGLVCGDQGDRVRRVLLCIDLTQAVVDEAFARQCELVMAYHPPLFKPITALTRRTTGTESCVFQCIRKGVAVYSTHAALDAADGGTNDVLAGLAGVLKPAPLEYVDTPTRAEYKFVTFVPDEALPRVSEALFKAGAGLIGNYSNCSFRSHGQGTFLGGDATNPAVGRQGHLETVDEFRLECVVRDSELAYVVAALRSAHPYEEPAFDIYPLKPPPTDGMGRVGWLKKTKLGKLAAHLKRVTEASCVQIVGEQDNLVSRAIIVAGSAGSMPFAIPPERGDVIITGEMRHHDSLTVLRRDTGAILLGHWASERPVLKPLASRLVSALPSIKVLISECDRDPLHVHI